MKHKILYILASLAGVVVAVAIVILLILASDSGSRWLTYYGAGSISTDLTINRVKGSILAGLELYGIEYRVNNHDHISIDQVELGLRPLALLGGKLHLKKLHVEGIKYDAAVKKEILSNKTTQSSQLRSLPLNILQLDNGRLEGIVLRRGDSSYELDHLNLILMGQIDQNSLMVHRFEAAGKNFYVNLTGRGKLLSPYPFQANLSWNALLPNGVQAHGKSDVIGDVRTFELNHRLLSPCSVDSRGKVDVKDVSTDSYQLSFIGDISGQGLPPTHIQALGGCNHTGVHIEKIVANILGGEITVDGQIVLQPVPRWELAVSGANLDPGKQWSQWRGNLAMDTDLKGQFNAGILTNTFTDIALVGVLFEQPFQMNGNLNFSGKEMTTEDLMLVLGENQLKLNGSAAGDLDLRFEFHAADPNVIWPGVTGDLTGSGFIKGPRNNPTGEINLKGQRMRYGEYTLQELDAHVAFDLKNTHRSNGRFSMENLLVAGEAFSDISFDWTGDFAEHRVSMKAVSAAMQGELEFLGGCHQDSCEFKVGKASFDLEKYGKWHLLDGVGLNVSYAKVKPFRACWVHEKANHCVNGSWSDSAGWEIEGDVNTPALIFMADLIKKVLNKEHLGWKKGAEHE